MAQAARVLKAADEQGRERGPQHSLINSVTGIINNTKQSGIKTLLQNIGTKSQASSSCVTSMDLCGLSHTIELINRLVHYRMMNISHNFAIL